MDANGPKGETGKGLDNARLLVLHNGTPVSSASSIMSLYDEATPYEA